MSTFDRIGPSQSAKALLLALSVSVLAACGSITSLKDVPEYLDSEFEHVGPREFITKIDLAKIRLGMSPLQVQNRVGFPMLSDKNDQSRWDYVVKQGTGAQEEFVPYAIYFKDQKVIRVAPLTPPPPALADANAAESAVSSPESAPAVAVSPDAVEVQAPEASLAVGADVGDAAAINDLLTNWAAAWSAKDVNGYLSFYADTFEHGKKSRGAWESQRKSRINGPDTIEVVVSDVQIDLQSETLAEVKFKQEYTSNRYKDVGTKTLVLSKASGNWKIQREEFSK
ncbi:outer membrane protein assembly factor BamE [Limnobacter sp.]|uniref:L,D-transpeptidase Cds6 family protein n=1 Tax=Limnobacter sp. TaxID=2003368 RepID=UPI0035118FBA